MTVANPDVPSRSSRDSEAGAGWLDCSGPGVWKDDVPDGTGSLSWLRPSVLWQSRNDVISKILADPTPAARARWVKLARQRVGGEGEPGPGFVVAGPAGDSVSMLLIGDPGEGDNAQYAVAHSLAEQSKSVDFAVICSDVIYPAGDQADYGRKFHHPYRNVEVPMYALPGNHDWYEGLHGFMHYFCKLDDPGYVQDFGSGPAARLAGMLWRKARQDVEPASGVDGVTIVERPPPDPIQPAPYFALDAGPVRYIAIDTGINGKVDAAQYEWLQRVSQECPERPKILLTGKPIYVDGKYHPGRVVGSKQTIDDVVTDPRANFVMAIGGDIHNYQRYPVKSEDGRTIQYVVSGGGGAYMHATHTIPPVNINGVSESDFRCYPLRRDSLARFSRIIDRRLFGGRLHTSIEPRSAARYYADRGIVSWADREPVDRLSLGERIKAALLRRVPTGRLFHRVGSEAFAFDSPPFFKNFLRIDVEAGSATVTCFGVTGCAGTEHTPSVEDRFTVTL